MPRSGYDVTVDKIGICYAKCRQAERREEEKAKVEAERNDRLDKMLQQIKAANATASKANNKNDQSSGQGGNAA